MPPTPAQGRLRSVIKPIERPASYVSRALTAAYYPLKGIYYFLRHPAYYPLFFSRLLPLSLISILVYTILFTFAFLPQYAFLALFHGWGAWVNAVVLVLGEGLVIIQGLFEGFFVDECRVDVFDVSNPNLRSPNLRQYGILPQSPGCNWLTENQGDPHRQGPHRSRFAAPNHLPRRAQLG